MKGKPVISQAIAVGALAYGVAAALLADAVRRRSLDLYSFAYLFALMGATDLCVTKFTLQIIRLRVETTPADPRPSGSTVTFMLALMCSLHVCCFGLQVLATYYRRCRRPCKLLRWATNIPEPRIRPNNAPRKGCGGGDKARTNGTNVGPGAPKIALPPSRGSSGLKQLRIGRLGEKAR